MAKLPVFFETEIMKETAAIQLQEGVETIPNSQKVAYEQALREAGGVGYY